LRSHDIALAGLKLTAILLPLPPRTRITSTNNMWQNILFVYIYIYIYANIYIHTHIYIYVYIHTHICADK